MNFVDFTGRTFDRLTVISRAPNQGRLTAWHCHCSCGATKNIRAGDLMMGRVKSCGCYHQETAAAMGRRNGTHRESRTKEYRSWYCMKRRCYNPKDKRYEYYGAMGVEVCDRWKESYETFLADMGRRPSPEHSIDRYPDPSGNYEPTNCRWATQLEQRHNRRDSGGSRGHR